jgi:hypothetical protein
MLPAVDRRSPAMMTPLSKSAATIVVPCGSIPCGTSGPPLGPAACGPPGAPGSSCGAESARKSAKDEVPVAMHAAVNRSPK